MHFPMLAAAWTFTSSPSLGQTRQEVLQRAEQESISIQPRPGLIYGLDRYVPQDDTEAGRWKPILIGAGIGLTVGLGIPGPWPRKADNLECVVACPGTGPRLPRAFRDNPTGHAIPGGLAGAGVGAAHGRLWPPAGDLPWTSSRVQLSPLSILRSMVSGDPTPEHFPVSRGESLES